MSSNVILGMSNWLLVFMFILFVTPAIIFKQYFLALTFIVFGLVFGFIEFLSNWAIGDTVSQSLWRLMETHKYQAIIVIGCMLAGWICLLIHLAIRFKK